jgi:phage shock protein PspC (stress-responsive transcriptional regulator)
MERLADQNSTADTDTTMDATMNNETNSTTSNDTGNNTGTNSETTATGNPQVEANPTPNTSTKRMLYRHPQDRLIGGVCGGLSDLTGIDANLIRILWVVATIATSGGGILAYVALWMLLPVGTVAEGQARPPAFALNGLNMGRTAVILIALGVLWFLANIGALPWLWDGFWGVMSVIFWPALLIGIGYLLLNYSGRGGFKLNWNWNATKERMQNGVAERMPTKQSLKESYNNFRQRFPLKRSRTDRIFMGVCGGIGQRIGIDPNLVRLVWAAFSVGSIGMGVLIYVLLGLFLVPEPVTAVQPYTDEMQDVQVIDARTSRV